MIVLIVIGAIMYFILYHKIFTVIYFKNMLVQIVFELIGCFYLSVITLGILRKLIIGLLTGLGGIISFLFILAVIVAIIAGIVYAIYVICNGINKTNRSEKNMSYTEREKEESTASGDVIVCPECGSIGNSDDQFCNQCGHCL